MKSLVAIFFILSLAACSESNYEACLRVETENQKELLENDPLYNVASRIESVIEEYVQYVFIRRKLLQKMEDRGSCKNEEWYLCYEREKVLKKSENIAKKMGYSESVNLLKEVEEILLGPEYFKYLENDLIERSNKPEKYQQKITKELVERELKRDLDWTYRVAASKLGIPGVDKEILAKLVIKTCNQRGLYQ